MSLFLTVALVVVAAYTAYRYFKKQLSYFEERGIPHVPGWPLLGNMAAALFRREHVTDTMIKLYKAHPQAKYIGVFDFVQPVLMLRDLDLIKSIAIKNFDSFANHRPIVDPEIDPVMGSNLFNLSGDRWKESRNVLSPAFTTSKMKGMYELMVECAKNIVDHMSKLPDDQRRTLETKDLFTKYANDAIATCAFGISVNSFEDPNNDFYVIGREATNFEGMTLKIFVARAFPSIMKWLNVKFVSDSVMKFFMNVIDSTVKARDSKGISRPDMVQLMMNARDKESKHLKSDLMEMTSQAFVFLVGGFEATATQMSILAHELTNNPGVQRRLQEEIDEVMERSNGSPTYEDVKGMSYLDAVFNESMRRHTQNPFLERLCGHDFELPPALPGGKPFTVKAGTSLWIPSSAIHMDPLYYENPETFDPDRYYEKKVTINDVLNLGFGIGPRGCIGLRFAIMEIKVLLVYILSKFNLKPTAKTNGSLKYSKSSFSINNEGGFWLGFEPRIKNQN